MCKNAYPPRKINDLRSVQIVLSKHCPDGQVPPGPTTRRYKMTFSVNRILDVLVSFATVGLALTIAGATAFLGA